MRPIRLLSVSLAVLFVAIVLLSFSSPTPTTAQGARSRTPTATIDPKAFDTSSGKRYKSQDGVIEISLPKGWETRPDTSSLHSYVFFYHGGSTTYQDIMGLQVIIGNPNTVYQYVFNVNGNFETPEAAFEAFQKAEPSLTFGDAEPAAVGDYTGVKLPVTIPGNQSYIETQAEVWVVTLPDNRIVCLILTALSSVWDNGGKTVLYDMIDGMALNPDKVPTATPTPTLNPKLVTPTVTLDAGAYDISTARNYKTSDGVVEISLPRSWRAEATPLDRTRFYDFYYNLGLPGGAGLALYVGATDAIYQSILRLNSPVDSPEAALQAFKNAQPPSSVTLGPVEPATWHDLTGSKMSLTIAASSGAPAISGEIWLVTLTDEYSLILVPEADQSVWESKAQPLLDKMIDSLKLNLDSLVVPTSGAPTLPPRLTPIPPRLTLTAFPLIPGQ